MEEGLIPNCNPNPRDPATGHQHVRCDNETIINILEVFSDNVVNLFIGQEEKLKSAIDEYYDYYWSTFYDYDPNMGQYVCTEEEFEEEGEWDYYTGEWIPGEFYEEEVCETYYYGGDYECDEWGCWWIYTDYDCFMTEFGEYCYYWEDGFDYDVYEDWYNS